MTVNTSENIRATEAPPVPGWELDDEIDLRHYIQVLIDWRREILLLAIMIAGVAGFAILLLRVLDSPQYQATATIAIARVKSDITFDDRFRTSSDTGLSTLQSSDNSRRAALLGLVDNGSIAQAVIQELGDTLREENQNPGILLTMIDAEIIKRADTRAESDLIAIHATADSPEKATAIANAWAKHYVEQVNTLYGQVPPEVLVSVETELEKADQEFQSLQVALEEFVADNQIMKLTRVITETQGIIDTLQEGKQTAISAIVEEELNARRQVIAAYINTLSNNRIFAFNKEQETKRKLVSAYIDAQIDSHLQAITKDRAARLALFETLATGQLSATLGVFTQQVESRLTALDNAYAQRNRFTQFLENTRTLQQQARDGGNAAAASNSLPLTLLKTQVFAFISEDLPPNLQLNLDLSTTATASAADQLADITALIDAIQTHLQALDAEIATLSQQLAAGQGFESLEQLDPAQLAVTMPLSSTQRVMTGATASQDNALSTTIAQRYADLFDVGGLAASEAAIAEGSALSAEIERLYPDLFTLGDLSRLVEDVQANNPLATTSVEKAKELLQLQGLEDVSSYVQSAESLNSALEDLENQIQKFQAQLQAQRSRERQLTQQRDLAWETYKTLSNKVAELRLERNATDSEVRLAVPAISPTEPVPGIGLARNVALAGALGLMLGVFVAFFASFMGQEPFLARRRIRPVAA